MKEAQQRRIEREEKERDSSESGKKHFMYNLVDKTYIGKLTTTFPL
jgi:hypothetical protein